MGREKLNVHKINEIVLNEIDFVELIDKFKQNKSFFEGNISVNNIANLDKHLEFKVEIYPQYPFKYHESESIRFINKSLIKYKHVMEDGMLCTHTIQSPILKEKLLADFNSLKDWVKKYYINKENDEEVAIKMVSKEDLDGEDLKNLYTEINVTSHVNSFGIYFR